MGAESTTASVLVEGIDTRVGALDDPVDLDRWTGLARAALSGLGFDRPVEMGLRVVDPDEMAELNRQHMGSSGPTDVLSFPVDGDPRALDPDRVLGGGADEPAVLGDVILCPAVAATGAAERSTSLDDELALLIVHGILHLLGRDHRTPDETAAMQAEERRLLDLHHRPSP